MCPSLFNSLCKKMDALLTQYSFFIVQFCSAKLRVQVGHTLWILSVSVYAVHQDAQSDF